MDTMDLYPEYRNQYLPDLTKLVVAVVTDNPERGKNRIGSGVLVNVAGRHFVATAGHCIKTNTRVFISRPLNKDETAPARPWRIIGQGRIETEEGVKPVRDVGYLEIEDPKRAEVQWNQLTSFREANGPIHFVGFPEVLHRIDRDRWEYSLGIGTFATTLIEATDDYLKLDFPEMGSQYDEATGQWVESSFPATPRGFSGGGCFGISQTEGAGFARIQYHLLGSFNHCFSKIVFSFVMIDGVSGPLRTITITQCCHCQGQTL